MMRAGQRSAGLAHRCASPRFTSPIAGGRSWTPLRASSTVATTGGTDPDTTTGESAAPAAKKPAMTLAELTQFIHGLQVADLSGTVSTQHSPTAAAAPKTPKKMWTQTGSESRVEEQTPMAEPVDHTTVSSLNSTPEFAAGPPVATPRQAVMGKKKKKQSFTDFVGSGSRKKKKTLSAVESVKLLRRFQQQHPEGVPPTAATMHSPLASSSTTRKVSNVGQDRDGEQLSAEAIDLVKRLSKKERSRFRAVCEAHVLATKDARTDLDEAGLDEAGKIAVIAKEFASKSLPSLRLGVGAPPSV